MGSEISGRTAVSIRRLSKTFPGTLALDAVDLDLKHGEVHALVGQNGSGKSTLIKVLAGFHEPDPGCVIEVDGKSTNLTDTAASFEAGFRFVHQDLGLVNQLSTTENLALGQGFTETGFAGRIRWRQEREDARKRMLALGYRVDVRRPVSELAAAERTGVAIARALYHWEEAKLLVADEPTASLPRNEVRVLFEAIARVRARGLAVLYVSHRLDEIFDIADRVTVLRDGAKVGTFPTSEIDQDQLISLMLGGEQMKARQQTSVSVGEVLLEARGLCGSVADNVDLVAHAGEVLGIAGLTGSSREELLPLLFGMLPRNGTVAVGGRLIPAERPAAAIGAGMALVPANRHAEGSITSLTVTENLTLTDLKRLSGLGGRLERGKERAEVMRLIASLDVKPPRPDLTYSSLSGGNQQKVVLGKWLRMSPRVLLLDEPTQGVDVHAKATIHGLTRDVADGGSAVVMASSDDVELCDTCDRVVVMRDGVVVATVHGEQLTPETLGRLELPARV